MAEATDTIAMAVDHAEIHVHDRDLPRLFVGLSDQSRWPKWCITAEVVEGASEADSFLTVVLVEHRRAVRA